MLNPVPMTDMQTPRPHRNGQISINLPTENQFSDFYFLSYNSRFGLILVNDMENLPPLPPPPPSKRAVFILLPKTQYFETNEK